MVQHSPTVAAVCRHGKVCSKWHLAEDNSQIVVQYDVKVCGDYGFVQAVRLLRVICGDLCAMTTVMEEQDVTWSSEVDNPV